MNSLIQQNEELKQQSVESEMNLPSDSRLVQHNSSLMRKQSGFKKLVKWKWYEIRNFINKFG